MQSDQPVPNVSGIVCDNKNCDFTDMSVKFDDLEQWLNMRCPKCGDNLLNQQALNNARLFKAATDLVGTMSPDEIQSLSASIDVKELMATSFLKNAKGLDLLSSPGDVLVKVSANEVLEVLEIKRPDIGPETQRVPLSDAELVAACSEWVTKLCDTGGRAWALRVPVDFTRDPDVLFTELIQRFSAGRLNNDVSRDAVSAEDRQGDNPYLLSGEELDRAVKYRIAGGK